MCGRGRRREHGAARIPMLLKPSAFSLPNQMCTNAKAHHGQETHSITTMANNARYAEAPHSVSTHQLEGQEAAQLLERSSVGVFHSPHLRTEPQYNPATCRGVEAWSACWQESSHPLANKHSFAAHSKDNGLALCATQRTALLPQGVPTLPQAGSGEAPSRRQKMLSSRLKRMCGEERFILPAQSVQAWTRLS